MYIHFLPQPYSGNPDLEWLKLKMMYKAVLKGTNAEQRSRALVREMSSGPEGFLTSAERDSEAREEKNTEVNHAIQEFRRSASSGSDIAQKDLVVKRTDSQSSRSKSVAKTDSTKTIDLSQMPVSRTTSLRTGDEQDLTVSRKSSEKPVVIVPESEEEVEQVGRRSWPMPKALPPSEPGQKAKYSWPMPKDILQQLKEPVAEADAKQKYSWPIPKAPAETEKKSKLSAQNCWPIPKPVPSQEEAAISKLYGRFNQLTEELERLKASMHAEEEKRRSTSARSSRAHLQEEEDKRRAASARSTRGKNIFVVMAWMDFTFTAIWFTGSLVLGMNSMCAACDYISNLLMDAFHLHWDIKMVQ
jgi:hypothetical protein